MNKIAEAIRSGFNGTCFKSKPKEDPKETLGKLIIKLELASDVAETLKSPGWVHIERLIEAQLRLVLEQRDLLSRDPMENELELARSHGESDGLRGFLRRVVAVVDSRALVEAELTLIKKSLEEAELRESRRGY